MDGDLTNQWPAMVAPAIWQPTPEACHNQFAVNLSLALYNEVDCTKPHGYQTVHVGQLTGDAASQAQPPAIDSAAYKGARGECDSRLATFLGGQWKDRKVRLRIAVPSADAWTGGARWYSCEAAAYTTSNRAVKILEVSLKDAFDALAELKFGCHDVPPKGTSTPRSCEESHNTEYVGHFNYVDMSYAAMKAEAAKEDDDLHRKCMPLVGPYVGVPNLGSGTWLWNPTEEDWNAGDRTMHCFLWLNETKVSKSLKGVGKAGWPIK